MIDVPASYLAIIFILILTGSGLPLPEEVPIVAAGVLAAHDDLNPWLAVGSCLLGALAGDCMMYFMGYHFGRGVLQQRRWFVRAVTPEREDKVEEMFRRHGLKVFFIARFLVVVRSPLLLAAGIMRVPFRRFLLIDLISATVVVGAFFGLSYAFGKDIYQNIRNTEVLLTVLAAIVVAVIVVFAWRRHVRKKAKEAEQSPAVQPSEAADAGGNGDAAGRVSYNGDETLKLTDGRRPRQPANK
jgi:membrane protein DedA with SNARE-associated domain